MSWGVRIDAGGGGTALETLLSRAAQGVSCTLTSSDFAIAAARGRSIIQMPLRSYSSIVCAWRPSHVGADTWALHRGCLPWALRRGCLRHQVEFTDTFATSQVDDNADLLWDR